MGKERCIGVGSEKKIKVVELFIGLSLYVWVFVDG